MQEMADQVRSQRTIGSPSGEAQEVKMSESLGKVNGIHLNLKQESSNELQK